MPPHLPSRMSIEEFLANFDYLDICHVLELPYGVNGDSHLTTTPAPPQSHVTFNSARFFGRWIRGVTAGGRPFVRASHWANPQYIIHLPSPDVGDPEGLASLIVALLQSDNRPLKHRAPRLLSIGFVLYRVCDFFIQSKILVESEWCAGGPAL